MPKIIAKNINAAPPIPDFDKLSKDRRDWLEIFGNQWGETGRVMPGTCERCVFGSGIHSESCIQRQREGAALNAWWEARRKRQGLMVQGEHSEACEAVR